MYMICGALDGRSVYDANGKVKWVEYPTLTRRLQIYREGLELIIVFRDYDDLFALAVYRRYVTQRCGIKMDEIFFTLALEAGLTPERWEDLARRMPDRSLIRGQCFFRQT